MRLCARKMRSDAARSEALGCYTPSMSLKSAALLALIGIALLTVLLAVGFVRDVSNLLAGVIAAITVLISLIHFLASLSVTIFLYVFYKAQS